MIWARIRAQNAVTTLQISRRFSYALTTPCKNSGVFSRGLECHPRPSCTWRTHMRHMPTLLKGASSQGLTTPPRCRFFADVASPDLGTYSRDDLTKLGRKQLQYICKVLGINQGIKSALMIEKISEHMDQNDLPELEFVPFHNNTKPKWEYQLSNNPLSIKLPSIKANGFGRIYQGVYPSVTTILSHTQSDETIKQLAYWGSKEVETMGQENFDKMMQDTMESGSNFHQLLAGWLLQYHEFMSKDREEFSKNFSMFRTNEQEIERRHDFIMQTHQFALSQKGGVHSLLFKQCQSFYDVFKDIENVVAVESGVSHGLLEYAGTVDCIAMFRDKLCLIDWKTSKRKRKTLKSCHDYPVQLAAYAAAVNADPAYDFEITNVALVFVYDDGSPADVHMLSLEQCLPYYYSWQGRLRLFRQNVGNITAEGLFDMATSDGTVGGDQAVDQNLEVGSSDRTAFRELEQGVETESFEYDEKNSSDIFNDFNDTTSKIDMRQRLQTGEQNHESDMTDSASQPVEQDQRLEFKSYVPDSKPESGDLLCDMSAPNQDSTEEIIDVKTSLNQDFSMAEKVIVKGEIVNVEGYCTAKPTIHEPITSRQMNDSAYNHPDFIERVVSMEARPHSAFNDFTESIAREAVVESIARETYCQSKTSSDESSNEELMPDRIGSPHSATEEIIKIETSPANLLNMEHDIEYMEHIENAASLDCDVDSDIESMDYSPDPNVCFDDKEIVKIIPQSAELLIDDIDHILEEDIESSFEDSERKDLTENIMPSLDFNVKFKPIVMKDKNLGLAHDKSYQQEICSVNEEWNNELSSRLNGFDIRTSKDASASVDNEYALMHDTDSSVASFQEVVLLDSNYHFTDIELFAFKGKDVFDFINFACDRMLENAMCHESRR